MKVIKVPRVSPRAFDKNRPASDLLKKQVAQLQHVVEVTRGAGALQGVPKRIRTEAQVAKFIAHAARALRGNVAAAGAPPPAVVPAVPIIAGTASGTVVPAEAAPSASTPAPSTASPRKRKAPRSGSRRRTAARAAKKPVKRTSRPSKPKSAAKRSRARKSTKRRGSR